jgi:hypothetical protein
MEYMIIIVEGYLQQLASILHTGLAPRYRLFLLLLRGWSSCQQAVVLLMGIGIDVLAFR